MKRVMLARQHMNLVMPHDYYLSSIASSFPLGVEDLLKKFGNIFPKDTPLRGIQCQIDLMVGVSIPNRLAYKSNPEDTKESQRQVENLIEKVWVRESLSPCVMPVILFNRTLSQILQCLVGKNLKTWEDCLPHAEFAYNRVVNSTISYSFFEVVYHFNPLSPLNLLLLPNTSAMMNKDGLSKANFVKSLHEKVKA